MACSKTENACRYASCKYCYCLVVLICLKACVADMYHNSIIFIGPVTEVKTDIFVTSFGPVSDVEMVCREMLVCGNSHSNSQ